MPCISPIRPIPIDSLHCLPHELVTIIYDLVFAPDYCCPAHFLKILAISKADYTNEIGRLYEDKAQIQLSRQVQATRNGAIFPSVTHLSFSQTVMRALYRCPTDNPHPSTAPDKIAISRTITTLLDTLQPGAATCCMHLPDTSVDENCHFDEDKRRAVRGWKRVDSYHALYIIFALDGRQLACINLHGLRPNDLKMTRVQAVPSISCELKNNKGRGGRAQQDMEMEDENIEQVKNDIPTVIDIFNITPHLMTFDVQSKPSQAQGAADSSAFNAFLKVLGDETDFKTWAERSKGVLTLGPMTGCDLYP
ncbi:hypothetical protein IAR50_000849 [Cryptococcus sp. DSM 104548]